MDERSNDDQAIDGESRSEGPPSESVPPPSQGFGGDQSEDPPADEPAAPEASEPDPEPVEAEDVSETPSGGSAADPPSFSSEPSIPEEPAASLGEPPLPSAAVEPAATGDRSTMLAGTRDRLLEVLSATDRAAESILDAARAEAEEAVRNARIEADEHVRSTHRRVEELTRDRMGSLSKVTEDLLGQAESVRQQVETLRRALDGATSSIAGELGLGSAGAIDSEVVPEAPQLSEPAPSAPAPETSVESAPPSDAPPPSVPPMPEPVQTTSEPEPQPQKQSVFSRLRRGSKAEESQPASGGIDSNAIEILIMQMLAGGADRTEIEHRLRTEFNIEDPSALLEQVGPFSRR